MDPSRADTPGRVSSVTSRSKRTQAAKRRHLPASRCCFFWCFLAVIACLLMFFCCCSCLQHRKWSSGRAEVMLGGSAVMKPHGPNVVLCSMHLYDRDLYRRVSLYRCCGTCAAPNFFFWFNGRSLLRSITATYCISCAHG